MKIHEYQAKQLLRDYGIPIPRGGVATSVEEAGKVAAELGAESLVVKSQVHAGGRAMGRFEGALLGDGGIRFVSSADAAAAEAAQMLGHILHTRQTGPGGREVRRVYIEQRSEIRRELYLSMLIDRASGRVMVLASPEGGYAIEETVRRSPDAIVKRVIDPLDGLTDSDARDLADALRLEGPSLETAMKVLQHMYGMFDALDLALLEINPLVVTPGGDLMALDAKIQLDDNALFRHPELCELRDEHELGLGELKASQHGVNYIKLDGNIGCLASGAGFAMATLDAVKLAGGEPANFLDVPPDSKVNRIRDAFELVLSDPGVKSLLVNVFGGGIMRCDAVADAILMASRETPLEIPLVVRLAGTNSGLALRRLRDSGPEMLFAEDLADAADKAVTVSQEVRMSERRHWWQRTVGSYPA